MGNEQSELFCHLHIWLVIKVWCQCILEMRKIFTPSSPLFWDSTTVALHGSQLKRSLVFLTFS